MKSIYKNETGRKVMEDWYDRFVARLEASGVGVEHRRVDTRYGSTNVVVAGPQEAAPLVCFHGAMSSAPAALAHIPRLLQHFRIYFPDTVGQPGRSDDRRLDWQGDDHGHWALDVIDALEMERITAFGISLGGYVILRLASIAPERVEHAVLWAPAGLVKPPLLPMFGLVWDGLMYNLLPSRARLKRVLDRTFTDFDEEYVSFFADTLEHVHPDRRFPKVLPDGALHRWDADVLLIVNEEDQVFPADRVIARAEAELPHVVQRVELEGCAHMPPFAPGALDDLLATVVRFVEDRRAA